MTLRSNPGVPLLARMLVIALAGSKYHENVLGDLQEELGQRPRQSGAMFWIWKEVLTAIPGLLALRARSLDFQSIGLTLFSTIAAYAILLSWGLYVTRPVMIGLRDNFADGPQIEYLLWYLPFRLAGVLVVGTAIAFMTFRSENSFGKNFIRKLAPLLLVLIAPQIWIMIASGEDQFLIGSLMRVFSDGIALYAAAHLGRWLRKQHPKG